MEPRQFDKNFLHSCLLRVNSINEIECYRLDRDDIQF